MTWKINYLEHVKTTGLVLQVIWQCSLEKPPYMVKTTGEIGFDYVDPEIPYDDLTEEIVIGWVKDKLGQKEVERIEQSLALSLLNNETNKNETGFPWG